MLVTIDKEGASTSHQRLERKRASIRERIWILKSLRAEQWSRRLLRNLSHCEVE